jgi:hypothetical protein
MIRLGPGSQSLQKSLLLYSSPQKHGLFGFSDFVAKKSAAIFELFIIRTKLICFVDCCQKEDFKTFFLQFNYLL